MQIRTCASSEENIRMFNIFTLTRPYNQLNHIPTDLMLTLEMKAVLKKKSLNCMIVKTKFL